MNSPDDQTILKSFGIALEKYRELRKFSQRDLAAESGIDQARIARYELGEINPTLITICRLAEALGVPPADLLTFA